MSTEKDIERKIIMDTCKIGCRLFKNNVGSATIKNPDTGKEYRVNFGLCKGSSDLIGWTPVAITNEMVGKTIAIFTAVEVKKDVSKKYNKDRMESQQKFIDIVNKNGGIAFKSDNPDEAIKTIIERTRPAQPNK